MRPELKPYDEKMQKTIRVLSTEYGAIRAGRANPAVLDKITVDYWGTPTKINAMGAISVSEARTLLITPWDKSTLKAIEKAIQTSDVGINPQNDGSALRLTFPPMTEERRKDLCKQIRKMGEDSKVALRAVRRDANDKFKAMKKANSLTEDDQKDLEKELQKLTDNYCKEVDSISAAKEKEIMEV